MSSTKSKTTNILTLDGGGVRGLSSLIILERLMKHVNQQHGLPKGGLAPRDIFSLVAGTSTGGLIALMLGRFGMSIDDCIHQYWTLSKEIFGHCSTIGKLSRGLLKDRYDGRRLRESVRNLAARKDTCDNKSVLMKHPPHPNGIPCTVLAAEFEGDNIRDDPAYLCSHDCDRESEFRVCDAARATTAAPYYFPLCRIGDRYFIDGGFGHNNPSFDIYTHYKDVQRFDVSPRVDMSKILIINIGTGVDHRRIRKSEEQCPRSSQKQVKRHRQSLTGITNMLRQMKSHATNAQAPFYILKAISHTNEDMLDVHRFTADTGLHKIKLDKYRELNEIKRLTTEYIDRPDVDEELIVVARKLAHGWTEQNAPGSVAPSVHDNEILPAPASFSLDSLPSNLLILNTSQQATTPPFDISTPRKESAGLRGQYLGQTAPISTTSSRQPSPLTTPESTLAFDTLGEDGLDIGPTSDRAEPSEPTPSEMEGARNPLPDTIPPRSAHPTDSLNGTTPGSSPNRFPREAREVGPLIDIDNKGADIALGSQFAPQEPP